MTNPKKGIRSQKLLAIDPHHVYALTNKGTALDDYDFLFDHLSQQQHKEEEKGI